MKRYLILMLLLICVPVFAATNKTTNEAVKLLVGPFFDSTDGVTPETAIDVTGLTVEIYREFDADTTPTRFANFVPTTSGGGTNDMVLIASSVSGMYSLEVTAAQLNFTGFAVLTIVDTDSAGIVGLPYWRDLNLTAANVVDAGYGTDYLQVDTKQLDGSSVQQASGYIKVSDGTGTGQIQLDSGRVLLLAATETQIDGIETTLGTNGDGLTSINLPDQTMNITGSLSGSVASVQGDVAGDVGGNVLGSVASVTADVTTDAASRTASKATGFSTHDAAAVKTAVEAGGSTLAQILADTGELQTNQGAWATATSVDLEDNAITAAKVTNAAWQELIELFFSFDATGTYGDESGSVVDQIADNSSGGGGDASAANQTTMLARLAAIMSKAAADPSVGTFDPSTHSLEAQQENPQGPPIID